MMEGSAQLASALQSSHAWREERLGNEVFYLEMEEFWQDYFERACRVVDKGPLAWRRGGGASLGGLDGPKSV